MAKPLGSLPADGKGVGLSDPVIGAAAKCLFNQNKVVVVQDGAVISRSTTEVQPDPNGGRVEYLCRKRV